MKLSFVVQGPSVKSSDGFTTGELLCSLHEVFPQAEIIFSTWEGESGALPFVKYLYNRDPGQIPDAPIYLINFKRLVFSSFKGVESACGDVIIKLRSDSIINPDRIIDLEKIFINLSPEILIIPIHTTPRHPYMIEDKITIGSRKEMLNFWRFDGIERDISMAFSKLPRHIRPHLYTTYQPVLAPEQILCLRYFGMNPNRCNSSLDCYISAIQNIKKGLKFINAKKIGFESNKWIYKDTFKLNSYIALMNYFPTIFFATILLISNIVRFKIKALGNIKYAKLLD